MDTINRLAWILLAAIHAPPAMAAPTQVAREKPPASESACTCVTQAEQFSDARKGPFDGAVQ